MNCLNLDGSCQSTWQAIVKADIEKKKLEGTPSKALRKTAMNVLKELNLHASTANISLLILNP